MEKNDSQEKIDFFLVSAHELRTSLTAMKWLFKMLIDGDFGSLNKTQVAMLAQATDSNERMITLINDTMTIIRTQGGSVPYATDPIPLNTLIDVSIKDFTSEAAAKGMHIRYTAPPSPIVVIGDKEKLRIAIHNLLENAIKYGAANTDITLTLAGMGGKAVLTVGDKGVVIPHEEHARIFEKFFRASNTREKYVGVGLGLYATKHIVERQGGTLTFTSTPLEGTIFTLALPLG